MYSGHVVHSCKPQVPVSVSLFRNGPGDTLGDASGLHLGQLLAFCLSPAKVLPRPDPSLLVITVGIHGCSLSGKRSVSDHDGGFLTRTDI